MKTPQLFLSIAREIIKIPNDTLKNPSGKYSRKSVTALVFFANALGYSWYSIIRDKPPVMEIIYAFLMVGMTCLGFSGFEKFKLSQNNKPPQNDIG